MATKKINQTELDANLVALMVSSHENLEGLNFRVQVELNSLLSDFIIEVSSLPEGATYKVYQLSEQLQMDVTILLEPFLREYENLVEEAYNDAVEGVVGQPEIKNGISTVRMMADPSILIQQAREKSVNILMVMLSQLSEQSLQASKSSISSNLIDDMTSTKDSLIYQLRRHFEAFLSFAINDGVSKAAAYQGFTHYYWQIQPELTRSGVCEVCKAHSVGGINRDGIYTLEDVPQIPVHPHCVCILIPLVL